MKRCLVLGCCGAGKSTLARQIQEKTGLDIIHLDQHYWKPSWVETKRDKWIEITRNLAERPTWIMDGNYSGTLDLRLQYADVVVYLDVSTWDCLWRITKRIFKYWGKTRPDMTENCPERFDLAFFHYVATFNLRRRRALIEKIEATSGEKEVHILGSNAEVSLFLQSIT